MFITSQPHEGRADRRAPISRAVACVLVVATLLLAAGIATAPALAAETTVGGSVITARTDIAHPGQILNDTQVLGAVRNDVDYWTKAVTPVRYLQIDPAKITAATGYNNASAMRAQVNVQRYNGSAWVDICWNPSTSWTMYPSGCPSSYRLPAYNGFVTSFHSSSVYSTLAWSFGNYPYTVARLPSGYYRVYTWYWYFDAYGRVIGSMTERPGRADYNVAFVDGAPDAELGATDPGTPGWIHLP